MKILVDEIPNRSENCLFYNNCICNIDKCKCSIESCNKLYTIKKALYDNIGVSIDYSRGCGFSSNYGDSYLKDELSVSIFDKNKKIIASDSCSIKDAKYLDDDICGRTRW